MALRKMLGSAEHPAIVRLMRLIETQSHLTLIRFAASYVREHTLPILTAHAPEEARPCAAIDAVTGYLSGENTAVLKAAVREARAAAQHIADPVGQAAARAIATACAVATTPTNALGFAFYSAAAYAYHTAGTSADRTTHDALATEELERICGALEAVCITDELHPVRVDWNC